MKNLNSYLTIILLTLLGCGNNKENYLSNSIKGDTIFYQNFEKCSVGEQTVRQVKQTWMNHTYLWGLKNKIYFYFGIYGQQPEIVNQDNKFLKIKIPKNTAGPSPGCQWTCKFNKNFDDLVFEFKVKFDSSFNFVKGGKLPGLAGGLANTGGLKPNGKDGWSARLMFWENGKLCFWVYHKDQLGKYGDSLFFKNKSAYFTFEKDKWYLVSQYIHLNSIGKADGTIEGYIDGELMVKKTNLELRTINSLAIDQLVFNVFLGGDEKEYESEKDEFIYLDDFIVKKHD